MEIFHAPPSFSKTNVNTLVNGNVTANAQKALVETPAEERRRRTSRSIKRKRFDDEIVEYSVNVQHSRGEPRVGRPRLSSHVYVGPTLPLQLPDFTSAPAFPTGSKCVKKDAARGRKSSFSGGAAISKPARKSNSSRKVTRPPTEKRRPGRPSTKHIQKPVSATATLLVQNTQQNESDAEKWKSTDDLALITAVQQINDIQLVHRSVKFSYRFTLQELMDRWRALMYDPCVSSSACIAMRRLHPEVKHSILSRTPYSIKEEQLLGSIKSLENPTLNRFQELLFNSDVFYRYRTAKSLKAHWEKMKQNGMLPDQILKPVHRHLPMSMTFSDCEEIFRDRKSTECQDEMLTKEMAMGRRKIKRKIRCLESKKMPTALTTNNKSVFGSFLEGQTLAILRGAFRCYRMRSKEFSFGRDLKRRFVDLDLSFEGRTTKLSRRQGTIKFRNTGDFFIINDGKGLIYVNGKSLPTGDKTKLPNNSTVEICGLTFQFLINRSITNSM